MADRPILFSAPMVRALIAGTKTQTRRLIDFKGIDEVMDFVKVATDPQGRPVYEMKGRAGQHIAIPAGKHLQDYNWSPRIGVGDRLYVREAWRVSQGYDGHSPAKSHKGKPVLPRFAIVAYEADQLPEGVGKVRQAMHLPRWASRLTLTVTDVRVERLQDISETDAIAEGADVEPGHRSQITGGPMVKVGAGTYMSPTAWYHRLWNDINGAGAWESNPWIVVYTFSAQHGNIDQIAKVA